MRKRKRKMNIVTFEKSYKSCDNSYDIHCKKCGNLVCRVANDSYDYVCIKVNCQKCGTTNYA